MRHRSTLGLALWLCLVLGARTSRAVDDVDSERAVPSEASFRRGRELLAEGRVDEACEAFRASQALRPSAAALGNIANCLEAHGDLAGALRAFEGARSLAAADPRAELRDARLRAARSSIERLTAQVARLALRLPEGGELGVTLDAEPLVLRRAGGFAEAWVNPGERILRVESPGKVPYVQRLQLAAAQTSEVAVPELAPRALPPISFREAPELEAADAGGWGLPAYLLAGGGVAVTAGTVFGGLAWASEGNMRRRCPEGSSGDCTRVAGSDLQSTQRLANTATALWAVGLASAGVGLTLLLLADDEGDASTTSRLAASCDGGGCSMQLGARF
jgi:hypothetical protein